MHDRAGAVTPAIVGSWPLAIDDSRARALGLPADDSLERVIEDYIKDFGAG